MRGFQKASRSISNLGSALRSQGRRAHGPPRKAPGQHRRRRALRPSSDEEDLRERATRSTVIQHRSARPGSPGKRVLRSAIRAHFASSARVLGQDGQDQNIFLSTRVPPEMALARPRVEIVKFSPDPSPAWVQRRVGPASGCGGVVRTTRSARSTYGRYAAERERSFRCFRASGKVFRVL